MAEKQKIKRRNRTSKSNYETARRNTKPRTKHEPFKDMQTQSEYELQVNTNFKRQTSSNAKS